MADKTMDYTHTHAAFPCVAIQAHITEADPADNEMPVFTVDVTNNCGFPVGLPGFGNTVGCALTPAADPADPTTPGVTIGGPAPADIGVLEAGATKAATWVVTNASGGDSPPFCIEITVSLWGILPSTPPHRFRCPA